jgi:iron complex outermembrane receptor protein
MNESTRGGRLPTARNTVATAIASILISAAAAAAEPEDGLQEVQITGSRIQQTGMTTPTPVTAVSAAEIATLAPGTMAEAMATLPQFFGSTTPAATAGFFTSPGAGNLNLRGLGTNRTLVLLNGRRVVSSSRFGGTDINIFPEAMLRTVETVTGGASAAYGTDAITGVVNFILDTQFTGLRGHVQGGITERGDNENYEAGLAGGFALGDRGHVLLSVEKFHQNGVFTYEGRNWYRSWGLVTDTTTANRQLVRPNVISNRMSLDGIVISTAPQLQNLQFMEDGQIAPLVLGNPAATAGNTTQSHSTTSRAGGTDNNLDYPNLQPESGRESAFAYLSFDLTDNLQLFAQGIHGRSQVLSANFGGLFGSVTPLTIFRDNAFLPEELRRIMVDNDIESFQLGRFGTRADLARDAATFADSRTQSFTLGFQGKVGGDGYFSGWNYSGYGQYGKTRTRGEQRGGVRMDRLFLAIDAVEDPATGRIVCNVTLVSGLYPDCQPLNLFGRGMASPQAIDWVTGYDAGQQVTTPVYYTRDGYASGRTISYVAPPHKVSVADLKQQVAELSFDGKLFEGWAGPISTAIGVSWRQDDIDQIVLAAGNNPAVDPNVRPVPPNDAALGIRGVPARDLGLPVDMQFSNVPNLYGKMKVVEAYDELLVPLLRDLPMLRLLTFNGGIRWADYSGSGTIFAWKLGLDAEINDQLRLRGTLSRDVRAATLAERFDRTGGATNVRDPAFNNENYGVTIASGGNPALKPEEADTITLGLVYRPTWAEGLSMSLDWYSVSMTGAIGQLTAQDTVDQCAVGAVDLCARIFRNATTNRIELVETVFLNVNEAKVSGLDLELAYRRPFDLFGEGGSLSARLFATWLGENSSTNFGAAKVDRAGQTAGAWALPEYKATASLGYDRGAFGAIVTARWIGDGLLDANESRIVDYDDNTVGSALYFDVNLSWAPRDQNWRVYANVMNALDRDPPVTASWGTLQSASGQTNPALFDLLGRRYTLGVGIDF